jgi:hypothetical protein
MSIYQLVPPYNLDRVIAEQADYYGMTVEQYAKHSADLADIVDSIPEWMEPHTVVGHVL